MYKVDYVFIGNLFVAVHGVHCNIQPGYKINMDSNTIIEHYGEKTINLSGSLLLDIEY